MTEHQTTSSDWKSQYTNIVQHFGFAPEPKSSKRIIPRFNFSPPENVVLIDVGHTTGVLTDISAGGLAFQLNHSVKVGRRIDVNIDHKIRAKVEVVSNFLEDIETQGFRNIHRNRTRFVDENDGYRCVVQTLGLFSVLRQF